VKIALLSTDNRDPLQQYEAKDPFVPTPQEALLQGFATMPEVEVHFVSCLRHPAPAPLKLASNVYYHSLLVPKIGWMRTGYQGCIRAVRKKMREIQPDIVHGQGTERECAISAVFSGFPNILTLHGNLRIIAAFNRVPPFSYNWIAARLEGFVLPRTDGVICITNYTREAVKSLAPRTWILPNAVDKTFFDVQPAPDRAAPPVGLCVGSICARKNQNDFIRALDPLAKGENFKILFASEPPGGTYGQEFLSLVRERPWCEHIGFLNREQLKARLAAASFVVLPTREDNCPMVVLEGMAAGVPVLASNVGGVPDLIEPMKTGLLCDPDRPETFREGIAKMLADRPWVQQMAGAARAEALRRFHPKVIAKGHLEIYREILGEGHRG
jgi:glycosyltransferase involved in cell wall biosynthesis